MDLHWGEKCVPFFSIDHCDHSILWTYRNRSSVMSNKGKMGLIIYINLLSSGPQVQAYYCGGHFDVGLVHGQKVIHLVAVLCWCPSKWPEAG